MASVSVVHQGAVVWARAYVVANTARRTPITSDAAGMTDQDNMRVGHTAPQWP